MSETSFPSLNSNSDKIALMEGTRSHTYFEVNERINLFAAGVLGEEEDLKEERIAFFLPASLDYVTAMHGVWRAGGIAVPLNVASAVSELDHYLTCHNLQRPMQRTIFNITGVSSAGTLLTSSPLVRTCASLTKESNTPNS